MAYFTPKFNTFFMGLAANNNKDWFAENKKLYEKEVKEAFAKFLTDLFQRIKEKYDPTFDLQVKDAVFRINKDIRFSKDKSPYKLHVSAVVSKHGRLDMQDPGMYIQFGMEEIWIGGGLYEPEKENLEKVRTHIAKNIDRVKQILGDKNFKKFYPNGIEGQAIKRIPKELKDAFEKEPLVANKQFYFMAVYEEDENIILRKDLLDWVIEHYEAGLAWNKFLAEAMKS